MGKMGAEIHGALRGLLGLVPRKGKGVPKTRRGWLREGMGRRVAAPEGIVASRRGGAQKKKKRFKNGKRGLFWVGKKPK